MKKIKPPELEIGLGLETYKSRSRGIGGRIKTNPEDFIVEEIIKDKRVLEIDSEMNFPVGDEKEYLHFTLQKTNWDTLRAIREISNRLGISKKRLNFAGTKDKRAITTQRVSVWKKTIEDLKKVGIKDIILRDFQYSDKRINLGDLWGNRFTVVIRDTNLGVNEIRERINRIEIELDGKMPNYFGVQRFGTTRPITHLVGREILKCNFEEAVMIYLAKVFKGENDECKNARQFLSETKDFKGALKRFPKYLGYENAMLNFLANNPTDFVGTLRRLPKKLRLMFVHAYQSYIFNKSLSRYIDGGMEIEELPLVGYNIEIDSITSEIIDEEGISQEFFRINPIPELSSEGSFRKCFVKFEDFNMLNCSNNELDIQFSLPRGSYATVLLREFMKNQYW